MLIIPLIAEPLFLTKYIEKAGTGTVDIFDQCRKAGLKPPVFQIKNGFFILTVWRKQTPGKPESQPESQPESLRDSVPSLLKDGPLSKSEISMRLGQKEISGQLNYIIRLLLAEKQIEPTIPDKPTSCLQKYKITPKGKKILQNRTKKTKK